MEESQSLEELRKQIIGIIDMDGFLIHKKFLCEELGIPKVGDVSAKSYFFDFDMCLSELDEKSRRHCMYLKHKIHHLPFGAPPNSNAIKLTELETIVRSFYDNHKFDHKSRIGYKGGHYEKDILKKLGIPSLNLEELGCPKASVLFRNLVWLETCRNHTTWDNYEHCAKVEVEAYGDWLERQTAKQ